MAQERESNLIAARERISELEADMSDQEMKFEELSDSYEKLVAAKDDLEKQVCIYQLSWFY
jgi:predicted nuclease with TOPRIM domain